MSIGLIDHQLFQAINQFAFRYFWLDIIGIFLAKYLVYIMVMSLAFFAFKFRKNLKMVLTSLLSAFFARYVITEGIRLLKPRMRPFTNGNINLLIERVNEQSFPSGHASFAFALATVIYLYNKKWGLVFFAMAILISIGRVFTGVHWPLDVLAGAAVGIFSGWLINKIIKKYVQHKRVSTSV